MASVNFDMALKGDGIRNFGESGWDDDTLMYYRLPPTAYRLPRAVLMRSDRITLSAVSHERVKAEVRMTRQPINDVTPFGREKSWSRKNPRHKMGEGVDAW